MEKLTRNNIIFGSITAVFGLLIILSPWLIWTSYKVMFPPGLLKSFSLIPSGFADGSWIFYDLLPILSYLPVIGGVLILVGVGIFFLEVKMYNTLIKYGYILAIVMFGIFVAFILIFVLAESFPIDLSLIGIPITILADFTQPPSLNGVGGWLCIVPAVGVAILKGRLKMQEYEEFLDEFVGLKQEEIKVHEKKVIKGSRKCPKCTNTVPGEQLFCEQCGHYF